MRFLPTTPSLQMFVCCRDLNPWLTSAWVSVAQGPLRKQCSGSWKEEYFELDSMWNLDKMKHALLFGQHSCIVRGCSRFS